MFLTHFKISDWELYMTVHRPRVTLVDLELKSVAGRTDTSWAISGTRKKASNGLTVASRLSIIS